MIALAGALLLSPQARAETLVELLPEYFKNSDKLRKAEADVVAAQERGKAAYGAWYPSLKAVAWTGRQHISSTNHHPKELDLTLTQLVYDFGSTSSKIEATRLQATQAELALIAAHQAGLLEAAVAYVDLVSAHEKRKNAILLEKNSAEEVELEKKRVQQAASTSIEVDKKMTLKHTATFMRLKEDLGFDVAMNKFRAVFKRDPENLATFAFPDMPQDSIPETLDATVEYVLEHNPTLQATFLNTAIAREGITSARAEGFFPKVEMIADHKMKNEVDTTPGNVKDTVFKGQVTWPLNLGLTAINTLKAAEASSASAGSSFADEKTKLIEQIRNSWDAIKSLKEVLVETPRSLETSRGLIKKLKDKLSRQEVEKTEVLLAENEYVKMVNIHVDFKAIGIRAAYTMLAAMGKLDEGDFSKDASPAPSGAKPGGARSE